MKIHPDQLHTLELTCKRCKQTKYAIKFKKYNPPSGLHVYDICMECINEQHRNRRKKCDGAIKSKEFLSMYGHNDKICYHERAWRYKKFCKKRLEVQKREQFIIDAGFSLHKVSDCGRIIKYLKGIGYE